MVVGTSRGVQSFETMDIRNRGGGLASQWQAIPQAINFWDLGSLDGNPYALADTICLRAGKGLNRWELSVVVSRLPGPSLRDDPTLAPTPATRATASGRI